MAFKSSNLQKCPTNYSFGIHSQNISNFSQNSNAQLNANFCRSQNIHVHSSQNQIPQNQTLININKFPYSYRAYLYISKPAMKRNLSRLNQIVKEMKRQNLGGNNRRKSIDQISVDDSQSGIGISTSDESKLTQLRIPTDEKSDENNVIQTIDCYKIQSKGLKTDLQLTGESTFS